MKFEKADVASGRSAIPTSTMYAKAADGLWTRPVKLSQRASAYITEETDACMAARALGADDAQMRVIVQRIMAARPAMPTKDDLLAIVRDALAESIETTPKVTPKHRGRRATPEVMP
jgi:hypothetical protein